MVLFMPLLLLPIYLQLSPGFSNSMFPQLHQASADSLAVSGPSSVALARSASLPQTSSYAAASIHQSFPGMASGATVNGIAGPSTQVANGAARAGNTVEGNLRQHRILLHGYHIRLSLSLGFYRGCTRIYPLCD